MSSVRRASARPAGSVAVAAAPRAARRWDTLDGLRGVAALVVVVHHVLLTNPRLSVAYYDAPPVAVGTKSWWLTYTPLHLVWAGQEAVLVFFVLSGFVLTLPVLAAARYPWASYYPRRVVRIYGPAIASLLLAAALIALVPRVPAPGLSTWLGLHTLPNPPSRFLQDATLLALPPSEANTPLWSLNYELLFSVALPLVVALAVAVRRAWPLLVLTLAWVVDLGAQTGSLHLQYLPVFVLGVLMAVRRESLGGAARRIESGRHPQLVWSALLALAVVALSSRWWLQGLGVDPVAAYRWSRLPLLLGAVVVVGVSGFSDVAGRLLLSRPVRFLGLISFSWYLTHEPIVVTLAFLLPGRSTALLLVLALPLSVVVGWAFHRLVERPFHRLAKRIGRRGAPSAGRRAPRHRAGRHAVTAR